MLIVNVCAVLQVGMLQFKANEEIFQRRMVGVNPLTSSELSEIKASFGEAQQLRI